MTIPTESINENEPAGSDQIALGDNVVRKHKTQVREIMEIDHTYPSSGQSADAGKHKKISLIEQADLGSGSTGYAFLGGQTVSGKPELVYTDEDDNDIQITSAGYLKPSTSPTLANWSVIMNLVYPVGSVVTLGVSTNPSTLYGVGTWTAIEGKVIVGKAASGTFNTLDATGGSETKNMAHTHSVPYNGWSETAQEDVSRPGVLLTRDNDGWEYHASANNTSGSGGSATQDVMNPHIVKYVWQRTA